MARDRNNAGPSFGHAMVDTPLHEGMAAYDALHPAVRLCIADAPVEFAPADALTLQRSYGVAATVQQIWAMSRKICPGYRPLREPEPRRRIPGEPRT